VTINQGEVDCDIEFLTHSNEDQDQYFPKPISLHTQVSEAIIHRVPVRDMSKTSNDIEKYHLLSETENSQSIEIQSHPPRVWNRVTIWLLSWCLRLFCISSMILNLFFLTRPDYTAKKGTKWGTCAIRTVGEI
jgi:hypothetical protein